MGRWGRVVGGAAVVLAAVLSGCGTGQDDGTPSGSDRRSSDQLQRQARTALDRWARAVAAAGGRQRFVPVGELTGQVGDWEPAVGEKAKRALMAGKVRAVVALSAASPGLAEVRWDDGSTRKLRTISAAQGLRELVAAGAGDCPDCTALQVTAARLTNAPVQTTRGRATAPTWQYTVRGTRVRLTRLAVAAAESVTVTPPPWDADNPPAGLSIESASTTGSRRRLSVSFTGAPQPARQPCGVDYTATAVESATAVVVIVVEHPHPGDGVCATIGARRTATADLREPLGDRTVLEVQQGLPVPVTITAG